MIEIKWQPLDLENIPTDAGLYAFKHNERWLYIGSANNLSVRLSNSNFPLQIVRKYFPGASFLCYLENSSQKLKQKLHKELRGAMRFCEVFKIRVLNHLFPRAIAVK